MAKKTTKPAPKKAAAPPTTLERARKAVVGAAEAVADAAHDVAASAKKHVIKPVGRAVGLLPTPKPKPVRPKKKADPKPAAPLPPRSKSAAGKMMSKNLAPLPAEDAGMPPKPKSHRKL